MNTKIAQLLLGFVLCMPIAQIVKAEEQQLVEAENQQSFDLSHFFDTTTRQVQTAVFLQLLKKMQSSEEDFNRFIVYTLRWMERLAQSDDLKDQELYAHLKTNMTPILEAAKAQAAQEKVAHGEATN